jgi:hypothetical protein
MSGKGSGRRPQQIPDTEADANWARIFGKTNPPAEPESNNDKEDDHGG